MKEKLDFILDIITWLENLSVLEVGLFGGIALLCVFLFLQRRKAKQIGFGYYSKNVAKTTQLQAKKIAQLENKLRLHEKEEGQVQAYWLASREDRSAYVLQIYNDLPQILHNIDVTIDKRYMKFARIHAKNKRCDPEKTHQSFLVFGGWNSMETEVETDRGSFLKIWLQDKLKPIPVTITYTLGPSPLSEKTSLKVEFKKEQLTSHLKNRLRRITEKPELTIL